MNKVLHPRDDLDSQHVARKEGGRGLTNIEETDSSVRGLKYHIKKSKERLITAACNSTNK